MKDIECDLVNFKSELIMYVIEAFKYVPMCEDFIIAGVVKTSAYLASSWVFAWFIRSALFVK